METIRNELIKKGEEQYGVYYVVSACSNAYGISFNLIYYDRQKEALKVIETFVSQRYLSDAMESTVGGDYVQIRRDRNGRMTSFKLI